MGPPLPPRIRLYDPLTTRQFADGTWTRDPIPDGRLVVPLRPQHLLYRANAWQLGQPIGTFLFDNMTAGLQASGAVATATPGNQFAAFELGSVRQALSPRAACSTHRNDYT
ncbi:MAG TPA: hypothetical protein VGH38_34375 [Bryobacteraceae bacterium]|jgi:hypothetical protein